MNPRLLVALSVLVSLAAPRLNSSVLAQKKSSKSISGWGTVMDPDKDCKIGFKDKKLSITIPATVHELNPRRGGMNAPRVLRKVKGDFKVRVKVTAEFKPGTKSKGRGRPFNGAGILIWQNDSNYLRVERNAYWAGPTLRCYPPLMEYWRDGMYSGANENPTTADYFKGKTTWLEANRQGKNVTVSISHDGKEWKLVKTFPVDFNTLELLVGVCALNTSDAPFTVVFEKLTIKK